jgi:hypothetical protein
MRDKQKLSALRVQMLALALVLVFVGGSARAQDPFLGPLHTVITGPSTVPGNGDENPYGVAQIPSLQPMAGTATWSKLPRRANRSQ